jgi:hypothetical protein
VFRSAEEKEAERREREAEQARVRAAQAEEARAAQEARDRAAWLTTPVGSATAAKQAGKRFLEVQLQVGTHVGQASFGEATGRRTTTSSAEVLAQIEELGWRLEHANYFYMVTGETSSERVFLSGQAVAVSGVTVGAYLFRNPDVPTGGPVVAAPGEVR